MNDPAGRPAAARPSIWFRTLPSLGFLRFLGTGVLNTIFGYAVFLSALRLGASLGAALVVSTLLGVAFNFQTSRVLVFRSRRSGLQLRFAAVYTIVLAVDYLAVLVLKRLGLADGAAQAVVLMPAAALAFMLQRHVVFRPEESVS